MRPRLAIERVFLKPRYIKDVLSDMTKSQGDGMTAKGQFSLFAGSIWYCERIRPVDKKVPQLSAKSCHYKSQMRLVRLID